MARQFGAASTAEQVLDQVDLTGKRVLVTGVSAGLGIETARALVVRGAYVLGTVRNLTKARAAAAHILPSADGGSLTLVSLDLASLASVRHLADMLLAAGQPFDIVIANAGVMACPKGVTADGFETQFGTNYLGHFVLINRLTPLLRPGSRVVSLASSAHRVSNVDLDDPNYLTTDYDPFVAYGRSKTGNILFTVEFDRRFRDRGIRAVAVHPGGIQTELTRHLSPETVEGMIAMADASQRAIDGSGFQWKTIPQGAATSVWAAAVAAAEEVGGLYCEDCKVAPVIEDDGFSGVRGYALDPDTARALWSLGERLTGEQF